MKPFRRVTGSRRPCSTAPDVDTDQIIPKQFLKRIERTGYGEFLFFDWTARQPGLRAEPARSARARRSCSPGANFGCGSSREHAAWALQDYGFEVVIAPLVRRHLRARTASKIGLVTIVAPGRAGRRR